VEVHVKVLAVLHIALSSVSVLAAMFLMVALGGVSAIVGTNAAPEDAAIALPILGITGIALSLFLLAIALPGLITGFGLLQRKSWARIVGLVLSVLHIINLAFFPISTVLGAYGLWVLFHKDTERLFNAGSAVTHA
jgi:hypothetical protein